jgi:hypothetical protein
MTADPFPIITMNIIRLFAMSSRAMKSTFVLFFGLLLAGCRTAPKENYQQAYEASLADGAVMMTTLRTLDTGDIRKTRQVAMTSLHVTLSFLPTCAAQAHPTAEQKQEELALARGVLNYMLAHREELDPQLPSVQMGVRGLQKILTQPGDVQRLAELSDYLAEVRSGSPAPPRGQRTKR